MASWTLNALLLNKRFLKSTDVYFSELRMACGKCGEIVGNYQNLVSHWDTKHIVYERKKMVAEMMKPDKYDEIYYLSDYVPVNLAGVE